jgi:GntR family transcriptional repressor for pyruvate dehydrogenase complex
MAASDPGGAAASLGAAVLAPIRAHAFEECVERLATAIRLGVFPPGSALPPERELAARLDVSRATLREAIIALRSAGMVATARGRLGGTTVSYQPPEPGAPSAGYLAERRAELVESLQFRRIVEPGACFVAAGRRLDPADAARLAECESDVRHAPDTATHRQADSRLHLAIAAATGSPMIMDAVTQVQSALHEMLQAIPVLGRNIAHSNRQHTAIVTAILDRRPAAARRAMEQHCDDTAALLHGLLGLPAASEQEPAREVHESTTVEGL